MGETVSTALTAKLQVGTQVSVGNGSATQLQATSPTILAKQGVLVQALSTNTVSIWVGGSDVTNTKGIELAAGQSIMVPTSDPSRLYVYTTTTSQKANYAWI